MTRGGERDDNDNDNDNDGKITMTITNLDNVPRRDWAGGDDGR